MRSATATPESVSLTDAEPSLQLGPMLVATDGTESSATALRAAAQLSAHRRASVVVVTVLEPLPLVAPEYGMLLPPAETGDARRSGLMERVEAQIRETAPPSAAWSVELLEGDPATVISRAAHDAQAQLIVLGLGHHNLVDRLFGGENALKVLRRARVPVLAVGPHDAHLPRRAVMATDFSAASVRAARIALEIFDTISMAYLVHVAPRLALQPDAFAAWMNLYGEQVGPAFERVRAELGTRPGLTVETMVRQGKPAPEILEFARSASADLIVTGSRGAGLVDRLIVGSTATGLIRGARTSVLAVPVPASAASTAAVPGERSSLAREKWADELAAFTKRNAGRRAALEVDDPELGAQAQEHDYPFLGAVYDHHDERVEIMLGDFAGSKRHLTRGISDVREVDILRDEAGRDRILRIAHGGGQTILTLSR